MTSPSKQRLESLLNQFNQASVLLVGDLAIDEMVYGQVERVSREAPVIILSHKRTEVILGGGANAAHNLAALGAKACVAGICGADFNATQLLEAMDNTGLLTDGIFVDKNRPTTTKTRVSGTVSQSVTQQMVRIDRESKDVVPNEVETRILEYMVQKAPQVQAILLSDYGLGVLSEAIIVQAKALAAQYNLKLLVDSQRDLQLFSTADLVTPNLPEAERNLGKSMPDDESVLSGGKILLSQTGVKNLLLTRGQDGMTLFNDKEAVTVPVFNKSDVFDVTGAGDTVVSTACIALCVGATPLEASILGNLAASLVVKHYGCATTSVEELKKALTDLPQALLDRINPLVASF